MVRESTMICVDNSDFMRNGDFVPTRLQAQQDAVNVICVTKTRANAENNIGLLTLANVEVLATLTSDTGRILSKLHKVKPDGNVNLVTGVRIAHLALKHRQNKENRMRIIVFVGSPINIDEKELIKLGKRLKKEKVNVDIISFGEHEKNKAVLTAFVNTLNGKDGSGSTLVDVPGPVLADAIIASRVIQGEDGVNVAGLGTSGFEFGVDPNEDPELALALRVSMEDQIHRQEQQREAANNDKEASRPETITEEQNEAMLLERALAMSNPTSASTGGGQPDFSQMSEEEQIAFAMQMSMQDSQEASGSAGTSGTSTAGTSKDEKKEKEATPMEVEDYSEVVNDTEFLQSVLENLPGVDPQSEAVRLAVTSLSKDNEKEKKPNNEEKK